MMLKDKVAVIYGAGGAIGSAVARAFANEGAHVFLTGREHAPVEAIAKDIVSAGGLADAAQVDALDERVIEQHLERVMDRASRIDISFNAVGIPNAKILGVPLLDLELTQFALPISAYTTSYFLTSRLAARRMIKKNAGVIMTLSAIPGRTGTPSNGGYGVAMAAKEALTRDLSVELAPHGIRVVCLRPHGMPETAMIKDLFTIKAKAMGNAMTWEGFQQYLANWTHSRRIMKMEELVNCAVFAASDKASGMTGTTVNLTMGGVAD
jgi:NAD(P)-dependent dehydrogenase (short-subunit alcohol dehydrogenase family)